VTDQPTFHDDIEGYCGQLSYGPEDTVMLHASCRGERFDVLVERWGAEREPVWRAAGVPGRFVPPPSDADAAGCRWPVSLEIPLGGQGRSGFYLITLTLPGGRPGHDTAHAGFVVKRAAVAESRPRALLMLATNTWNAYNPWGGASLYSGGRRVSFRRPMARGMLCRPEVDRDDRKARPVRWGEEPDVNGTVFQAFRMEHGYPAAIGSSGWFTFERRFVEWAEREGYRFDYAVSSDLEDPAALDGYDLLIDVGHDEYWSAPQRRTVEDHLRRGGALVSLSGNTMFWQVRLEDGGDTMVGHKYTAHETDPEVAAGRPEAMTGMWCDPIVGRPEWSVLGGGSAWGLYYRFGRAVARGSGAFTVYRHDHWLLAGTGLGYGDLLGATHGVVGYETLGCRLDLDDHQLPVARPGPGMPAEVEVVAFTPSSNLADGEYPASISALSDQGDLEFIAGRLFGRVDDDSLARCRYGNAVILTCRPFGPAGGEVVTVGTTDWVFGLTGHPPDPAVVRVTANALDRHLGGTP
jgi:hypothetical protein